MRINSKKIAKLMEDKGISRMMLCVLAQITPVYLVKVLRDNQCCEEIAHAIAETLAVDISEII